MQDLIWMNVRIACGGMPSGSAKQKCFNVDTFKISVLIICYGSCNGSKFRRPLVRFGTDSTILMAGLAMPSCLLVRLTLCMEYKSPTRCTQLAFMICALSRTSILPRSFESAKYCRQ